jgi:hypothetical protein
MNKTIINSFASLQKCAIAIACIAVLLLIAPGCESDSDDEYLYRLPPCENEKILKTFKDEPGFITYVTDPAVDRVCYYHFTPAISDSAFSESLHFWTTSLPDVNLEKYVNHPNEIVYVSGNVTNCLSTIRWWGADCDCLVAFEYNILKLSSIKKVKE